MDKGIEQFAKYMIDYLNALETGVQKSIALAPLVIRQEFEVQTRKKLNNTKDNYMSALNIEYRNNILVVELDPKNWLANAEEDEISEFDMKQGLLRSPKAKLGKSGYKYLSIPMEITKSKTESKTTDLQSKIKAVLQDPLISKAKLKLNPDGTVTSTESIMVGKNPELQGLYRIRRYKDIETFNRKGRMMSSQFVVFRTVSENPRSAGKWIHPGFSGKGHIFPQVEAWAGAVLPSLIAQTIEDEIKKVK